MPDKARVLATYTGQSIEPWMQSSIWGAWVGCENCREGGPDAPCWGRTSCHGYFDGCGCRDCIARDRAEAESGEDEV